MDVKVTITIITPWDALSYLYRSTFPSQRKTSRQKKNEIHVSEPGEIPFSISRSNLSVDNYNRQLQKSSKNDQCLLEVEPGKNYRRCIWCVNFSSYQEKKERISFNPNRERQTPFSLE